MPRGKKNQYRVNYKIWFAHGSITSTQDRDLTAEEMVRRLHEVALELTHYAASIERDSALPLAARKL